MASLSLLDYIHEYLEEDKIQLPPFNMVAMKIRQEAGRDEPDVRKIQQYIIQDQVLTVELLKVANSSFYRGLDKIATINHAVVRLGANDVSNAVTMILQRQQYSSKDPFIATLKKQLWKHAVGCAMAAHWVAKEYRLKEIVQEAFFAGLVHDVGKLMVLAIIEDLKKNRVITKNPSEALIREVADSLHAAQGHLLLQKWNLPDHYCEVARDHHLEIFDSRNLLLTTVRLANKACNILGIGPSEEQCKVLAATQEAAILNISEIDAARLEIMLEDAKILAG